MTGEEHSFTPVKWAGGREAPDIKGIITDAADFKNHSMLTACLERIAWIDEMKLDVLPQN
jgi:hypothetical protein